MRKASLAIAALIAFIRSASLAQSFDGEIGAGHVLGNPSTSAATATDASMTLMFDRAFCGTNNAIINRIGGTWGCSASTTLNSAGLLDNIGAITTRRATGNAGGTLTLGGGTMAWQWIGNQLAGGDLLLKNPAAGNVLVFPETGGCVGVQANLTACSFMLDVGPGAGIANQRINGATFTNDQGPSLTFSGGGTILGRIGSDCVFYGATACNNDVYVNGPASSRHFGFYNWGGVKITNTPTPAPTHYVGGALTVTTDSVNAFVGGNAITAQSNINTGGNFPTAITALANVVNTTSGGPGSTVWGVYSHCDLGATTGLAECASVEGTASNRYGAPGAMPAATVPNPTQPFPTALKATCGAAISPPAVGLFNCAAGVWVHYYEGNGGWPFTHGIYVTEGAGASTALTLNAVSATATPIMAEIRSGTGKALVLRAMNAGLGSNLALEFQNSAGATVAAIQNNGAVSFTNGGSFLGVNNFTLADPSGFTLELKSTSAPALTASRILTFDVNDAARTIDIAGNLTLAAALTTSGANAITLTTTGVTNLTLPTSGTLATTSNNLGVFAATTSAQLLGVISDEVGSGLLVFNDSPVFVNSITSAIVAGGSAASSSLILRSTAGAGTSDAMVFQTGSQVEAGRITTGQQIQWGSNFAPNTGVKVQISANSAALPAPTAGTILHLANADASATRITLDSFGTGVFSSIINKHARGTNTTKSATQSGDLIGSVSAFGYQTTTGAYLTNAGSAVAFVAIDNFTSTAAGSRTELHATQSGTTTSEAVLRADKPTTATQTALTIYDVDNNALERVTVGAADSCGAGFKCLRIAN